jgi:hypothetical protein
VVKKEYNMIVREAYSDNTHRLCRQHYEDLPSGFAPLGAVEDARDKEGCEVCDDGGTVRIGELAQELVKITSVYDVCQAYHRNRIGELLHSKFDLISHRIGWYSSKTEETTTQHIIRVIKDLVNDDTTEEELLNALE